MTDLIIMTARKSRLLAWLATLGVFITLSARADVQVNGVRVSAESETTRVVFELSGPVDHHLFTLDNPGRVVVDVPDARLSTALDARQVGLLKGIRGGVRQGDDLRLVLDLNGKARPRSFLLKPGGGSGHRLVIDLDAGTGSGPVKTEKSVAGNDMRDVVIAIDAGHGGKDPGARGPTGLREKDAVLALARKLAAEINAQPGMKAVLTRNSDVFLRLRTRIDKARKHRADMFVSLHADAFNDPRAHGSSVYVLSNRGASNEAAQWLAEKENAADLVGGVSLDDKDDQVAQVLLDLSQEATIEASIKVASRVLGGLKTVGKVHRKQVERAGFVVLKSPDIPSILVETAFISNPTEEARLRDSEYQTRMAKAIAAGVRDYFQEYAPPGTRLAAANQVLASN